MAGRPRGYNSDYLLLANVTTTIPAVAPAGRPAIAFPISLLAMALATWVSPTTGSQAVIVPSPSMLMRRRISPWGEWVGHGQDTGPCFTKARVARRSPMSRSLAAFTLTAHAARALPFLRPRR